LQQAEVQLDAATESLASAGANLDVDLSSQLVALTSAQTFVELDVQSLKTADQIRRTAINLLA